MTTHNIHGFDRKIYDCECGIWWFGGTSPTGGCDEQPEECPRCGEMVAPTIEYVD